MTKEQYIHLTQKLRENPEKAKKVISINHVLTGLVFLVYPLFLLILFLEKNPWLARAIIVPLDSFILLSFVRYLINAPRPYEKFEMDPVIEKDTTGKSFPSRHVFSVFIIAMTIFYMHPGPGILLGIIGIILGAIRVVGGVHEPRDVIVGAIAGILCGIVGYYIIP